LACEEIPQKHIIEFQAFGLQNRHGKTPVEKWREFVFGELISDQEHLMRTKFDLAVLSVSADDHNSSIIDGCLRQQHGLGPVEKALLTRKRVYTLQKFSNVSALS